MSNKLGQWAVIDIETTGIDSNYDSIIDIGYLQFDGIKLEKKYSSLVQYDGDLSQFIQKLTGITSKMVKNAPTWNIVKLELEELYGHSLIAHNAEFEKSFLSEHFEKLEFFDKQRETYEDSLYFLSLLFPEFSSLKLEGFIQEWGIADKEMHRGYEDSLDLLKVMLMAVMITRKDREWNTNLEMLFQKYKLEDYWFYNFFALKNDELQEISDQIEFDLDSAISMYLKKKQQNIVDEEKSKLTCFDLNFSGKNIENILKDENSIRDIFSHYSYRESQKSLALRVGQSFKNKVHSIVQAPTGTGKTLGYLLPASLFSLSERQQVLISTGTKALQKQAMEKDVPQLFKLLGIDKDELKVRTLIGSNNHICEVLFLQALESTDMFFDSSFEDKFTYMYFDLVFKYNERNEINKQIIREKIPYVLKRKVKIFNELSQTIAVDFRSCTGYNCPSKDGCSYYKGIQEAKEADIIIGNHALMFSWPGAFPRPQYVVVDEAHKIEGETTSAFSVEITKELLVGMSKNLLHLQGIGSLFYLLAQTEENKGESTAKINKIREDILSIQKMLDDHLGPIEVAIEQYFKKMPRYTSIFWNENPIVLQSFKKNSLGITIFNHMESIHYLVSSLHQVLYPYIGRWEAKNLKSENETTALTRFETFFGMYVEDVKVGLEHILEEKEGYANSIKFHEEHGHAFLSAPIDVGRALHQGLLETSSSVVYTSATLGNAKGDQGCKGMEWATGYSYLDPKRRFKNGFYLPAVYDYENKTKVFLCDDTLPFYNSNFVEKTMKEIIKLICKINGRSLLLFSAKSRFEVAREMLLKELDGKIPVFVQGMGSNVVDEFKESGEGVLLGMESFGEGIDIPGNALQFIFVDKIPDLRMDYVIQERRNFYDSNLGNEFTDYYLAHRTRSLHQKLGRLLRTDNDFGGVIVVDSRIKKWKGNTMEKFLKLMEPYKILRAPLTQACDSIAEFINN